MIPGVNVGKTCTASINRAGGSDGWWGSESPREVIGAQPPKKTLRL